MNHLSQISNTNNGPQQKLLAVKEAIWQLIFQPVPNDMIQALPTTYKPSKRQQSTTDRWPKSSIFLKNGLVSFTDVNFKVSQSNL